MNNLIDSHHKDYLKDLKPEDIKIKDFRKLKAFQSKGLYFWSKSCPELSLCQINY